MKTMLKTILGLSLAYAAGLVISTPAFASETMQVYLVENTVTGGAVTSVGGSVQEITLAGGPYMFEAERIFKSNHVEGVEWKLVFRRVKNSQGEIDNSVLVHQKSPATPTGRLMAILRGSVTLFSDQVGYKSSALTLNIIP
jgi:hypothetical protein